MSAAGGEEDESEESEESCEAGEAGESCASAIRGDGAGEGEREGPRGAGGGVGSAAMSVLAPSSSVLMEDPRAEPAKIVTATTPSSVPPPANGCT